MAVKISEVLYYESNEYAFFNEEGFSQLNGIFRAICLRWMLEGIYYRVLDIVFSFVFGYDDIWLWIYDYASLTHTHFLQTSIVNQLLSNKYCIGWSMKYVHKMASYVKKFKTSSWHLFEPHCQQGSKHWSYMFWTIRFLTWISSGISWSLVIPRTSTSIFIFKQSYACSS